MAKIVTFEGVQHSFPDDATDAEVQSALQSLPIADTSGAGIANRVNAVETPSVGDKLLQGVGDAAVAAGQMATGLNPQAEVPSPVNIDPQALKKDASAEINNIAATREANWQGKRAASGDTGVEVARGIGSGLAAVPVSLMLPEIPELLGSRVLGQMATQTMQGGVGGAMQPVTDNTAPFLQQKIRQIGMGSGFGGFTGGMTGGAQKFIDPVTGRSSELQSFIAQGGRPTFGQMMGKTAAGVEDKLTSIPGLGDLIKDSQREAVNSFNKIVYNKVLEPIGETYTGDKVGHDGVRYVGDKLSQAYENLVPNLKLVPDHELMTDLASANNAKSMMSDQAAQQFDKIVTTVLPNGPLQGQSLKNLESQLTYEIGRFGKSPDPNHQMIADALSDVRTAVTNNLARSNPAQADKLNAINTGWANLVRLERAASNTKDGVFTPDVFANAVKATDQSTRKRDYARGTALLQDTADLGRNVIGSRYPDSGTPGRMLMSGLALGGASAGHVPLAPQALAAGALASLPYLPGIRNMGLTATRPAWAPSAAELLGQLLPPLIGTSVAGGVLGK